MYLLAIVSLILVTVKSHSESEEEAQPSKSPVLDICEKTCNALHKDHDFIRAICEGHCINNKCYEEIYGEFVVDFASYHFQNLPEDYETLETKRKLFMDCWQAEKDSGADTVEQKFYEVKEKMKMYDKKVMHQKLMEHNFAEPLQQLHEKQLSGLKKYKECREECVTEQDHEFDIFINTLCSSRCTSHKCFEKVYSHFIVDLSQKIFKDIPQKTDLDAYNEFAGDLFKKFKKCTREEEPAHDPHNVFGDSIPRFEL